MTKPTTSQPAQQYAYNSPQHEDYKLIVSTRFCLAFIVGYFVCAWCNATLAYGFYTLGIERAESVFLALIFTLIFACIWVLMIFCIQSLKILSMTTLPIITLFAVCRFYILPNPLTS
ncbi:hypothetical protein [Moraxella sp. ZY210820]|uniref:hypothetical protein n=1 Tax=unclassified Moraxella TaxID=2685852 RepID=UPI00272F0946|nr:hypothetical protein [Moraxella sp. ZY210820]WLF83134.1 hypothetical protein LU301_07595 [Moraxella sp. ZY210820]